MDRDLALDLLDGLHAAQTAFHSGGSGDDLRARLDEGVLWRVPGDNAIAGTYSGIDQVMEYFARRRELAAGTFRMERRDILTGDGDVVAALTDGIARIGGEERRWSTVGLYRFRGRLLAECWLLPLDADQFDQVWSGTWPRRSR
jgi:ketosteroid isomerase-like protein